ncbi:MAG: KpsF/GutQ family sugar-phosphate isomerase [Phycisphaerales bacterium]|nr:KpsF/GutQ family sugar-phosphate isomerase [Phycisphaerales bacterium]
MTTSPTSSKPHDPGSPGTEPAGTEISFVAGILQGEATALSQLAAALSGKAEEASHWQKAIDMIDACKGHVVLSGMGKSGLIGAKISATFSSLGIPSHVVHPADAVHGDLGAIRKDDVVMLLSHSGRTEEVISLATLLRADGVQRLAVSASHDSDLARLCDADLALGPLEEVCPLSLAPTTSTTLTLAMGDALALAVARRRCFNEEDFHQRHPGGSLGDGLRPIGDLLRFRVGENLTVLQDSLTVGKALEQACETGTSSTLRHSGAIILVDDDGILSGIFTDGDLRRLVMQPGKPLEKPISEVMTSAPRRLTEDQQLMDARQMVAEHRIDEIPVVDAQGRPVGMIDIQDLMSPRIVVE